MKKTCAKCKIEKEPTDFYSRRSSKDGLRSHCKGCMLATLDPVRKSQYDEQRYIENKDEIDKRSIAYYHNNKDKKKEYDQKNMPKILAKRRERYHTDINYKLTCNLRARLNQAVRRDKRIFHTLDLLGCTVDFLRNYLEMKFTQGMSWEAVMRGEIHIDHIIPCVAFDMADPSQQKKCFHYTNLQPLWAKDNYKKHSKLVD